MCKEKLKTLWMQEFILTPSHHCAASLTYDDGQYSVDLTPALISHHTHAAGIIVYRQLSPPEQKQQIHRKSENHVPSSSGARCCALSWDSQNYHRGMPQTAKSVLETNSECCDSAVTI